MKTHKVYKLANTEGTIEYIGCTYDTFVRYNAHIKRKTSKFYGRDDLSLIVIKTFNIRKEALNYEGKEKIKNGFKWSERENSIKSGKKGGMIGGPKSAKILGKPIRIYEYKTNNIVGDYTSASEAARILKLNSSRLSSLARKERNHYRGYIADYI